MVIVDRALAVLGRSAVALEGRVRGSRRVRWVLVGLVALSIVPTFLVWISPRPTDLTFEDVRLNRIPALTSWVRLGGDLERDTRASGYLYRLFDPGDRRLYVVVDASSPLDEGRTVVTGQLSGAGGGSGMVGSIAADVPAVLPRDEPFQLILLPLAVAIALAIGIRVGYPVARRERRTAIVAAPLAPGERLPARWSGRIGAEVVDRHAMRSCTVAVAADPVVATLIVRDTDARAVIDTEADAGTERTILIRRGALVGRVRLCRTDGTDPGAEVHAPAADLVLVFDRREDRDRLVASLA